jgi:hypothetical protein
VTVTVYVDDWRQQTTVGRIRGRWSHLFSDVSDEELHAFAEKIGLSRAWFQKANDPLQLRRHYDVVEAKRLEAIAAGAEAITWREAGRMRCEAQDRIWQERAT